MLLEYFEEEGYEADSPDNYLGFDIEFSSEVLLVTTRTHFVREE